MGLRSMPVFEAFPSVVMSVKKGISKLRVGEGCSSRVVAGILLGYQYSVPLACDPGIRPSGGTGAGRGTPSFLRQCFSPTLPCFPVG